MVDVEQEVEVKKNSLKDILSLDIKDILKKDIKLNFKKEKKVKSLETNKEIVSFDIGEDFIKIVVGKYNKDNLIISKCIETFTPKDSVYDGKIINEEILINHLEDVLENNNIKAKYGSVTTNSTLIINREMVIPKVEKDEVDTVISFEISKYLPINLNDYIVQTIVLDDIEIDGIEKQKVHTICYPEKIARSYNDLLKELDLKPFSLDIKFNSLNKIINYSQEINSNDYEVMNNNVFIEIGSISTDINIYNSKGIDFTRIVKLGYKNIEEFDIDKNISFGVDSLIEEVDRIFQFYRNRVRGNRIDKVYLLGEGSRLDGLDKYMEDKLGVSVEAIDNIGFVEFKSKAKYDNEMYKYLNAMGTIIRL